MRPKRSKDRLEVTAEVRDVAIVRSDVAFPSGQKEEIKHAQFFGCVHDSA